MKSGRKMKIKEFLFPKFSWKYLLRICVIAAAVWLLCRYIILPVWIEGTSMEPTFHSPGFNFCFTPAYWISELKRGDVVILSYAGSEVMILKRVLAFEEETIEFRAGICYVDGVQLDEPYVKLRSDWNLPPFTVPPGKVYVVGDNRSMPPQQHIRGAINRSKIKGKPLW